MMGTKMIEQHLSDPSCRIFGGIALNNSVGGFNLNALDAAFGMGTKTVYMPTVSARNHILGHKGHFVGSGNMEVAENPIVYVDEKGEIDPAVIEVLKYVAKRPDLVLCTGHGSAYEIDHLIPKAFELGVKYIIVNHPHFLIGASWEQIASWAKQGAYIELNAAVFKDVAKTGTEEKWKIGKILENAPIEKIVLDSDLGQKANCSPVEGMLAFIEILMNDFHVTEEQINIMGKKTPAMLMGMYVEE
jgi:hypothetical protein